MNEKDLEENYSLQKVYQIESNDNLPSFNLCADKPDEKASVYVWASKKKYDSELTILYVGKAGYGLQRRLSQHKGGIKHGVNGRKKGELIQQEINSGRDIFIYYRYSEIQEIFGQNVSSYSLEENALYLALSPKWNKAGFPIINRDEEMQSESENISSKLMSILNHDLILLRDTDENELNSYLDVLSTDSIKELYKLIKKVHDGIAPGCSCKLVRGYTKQEPGYNNIPMIVYAEGFTSNGRAKNRIVRIALHDKPKIFMN